MTIQEKIVKYMEIKARNLPDNLGEIYLKEADKVAVLKWNDKKAELCFNRLKHYVYTEPHPSNNLTTCPFCLIYSYKLQDYLCPDCEYGETHGTCCDDQNDDYGKIIGKLLNITGTHCFLLNFTKINPNEWKEMLKLFE